MLGQPGVVAAYDSAMPTPDATTPLPALSVANSPRRLGLADLPVLGVALVCAALGLALAAHHPLSPTWAVVAWLTAAAVSARWWAQTPALLMAALPLIGLAPWTGWITFEEQDLLVLACAAGGYAAVALGKFSAAPTARVPTWRRELLISPLAGLLMAAFGASLLLAMQRGFTDAGGFEFGWFQGYHEPMNSVRLTKPFFLAALLLPLWIRAGRRQPRELAAALLWGMVLALAGASLAALMERLAFTGLLDFSTDYRSTALFWEMHVGGAALDGCLALTLPFAVLALLRERSPWRFALLMALAMLAAYAVLTTFSRGLYAAVPVSLALLVLLRDGQRRRVAGPALPKTADAKQQHAVVGRPGGLAPRLGALLIGGGFVAAAGLMFGGNGMAGGGYRGLLALLGVMAVLLVMPASLWLPSPAQRVIGLLMGALLAAVLTGAGWALALAVPKAAYAEYVLAFSIAVWLRWQDRPGVAQPVHACLVNACWFWLLGSMVVVAGDWGGDSAMLNAVLAMLVLGLTWPLMLLWPALWPLSTPDDRTAAASTEVGWRSRSLLFGGLLLAAGVVASLGGGQYVRDRASSWHQDMQTRSAHWKESLAMLNSQQDWWFGKGAGRYVATHFFSGPIIQHTGDYRVQDATGKVPAHLVLTGGQHMLGYGELFRISQRITAPQGAVQLAVRARAARDVALQTEICEKQLLYIYNCLSGGVLVKGGPDWQALQVPLGTAPPAMGGSWYAPRFVTFSVAVNTTGGVVDIASLQLRDASGQPLLHNGDFQADMARWFFSSDRYHLPWHIKNMGLHLLFEDGLLSLALLSALLLLALLRLSFGRGRDHALAPALVASLVGFLVVGLFDSLLDVPRLAFMFYTVLLFSLGLRALPDSPGAEPSK